MIFAIVYVFGVVIGLIASRIISRTKAIGSLVVDYSDPDGPYLFLRLSPDFTPEQLKQNTQVTFNVETTKLISRK